MECLLLLWMEDCNKKQILISLASIQARVLRLVATLKENDNYKETKKEDFFVSKGWFHRSEVGSTCVAQSFGSRPEWINVPLSGEAASSDKDATGKFATIFQESQAVLVSHSSMRLLCKNFTGFGWNVNGILEYTDNCGNVDTAAIQEVVLDIQPEEFSDREHGYK